MKHAHAGAPPTLALILALAAWPALAGAEQPSAPRPAPHAVPARTATPPAPPTPAARAALPAPAGLEWRRYADAREVQLRNIAAIVRIMPEDRSDVAFAIVNQGPLAAPQLRMTGERLIIDGGLLRKIRQCRARGEQGFAVLVDRQGWVGEDRLPIVYLRVPEDVELTAGGAVSLWMTPARRAHVALSACGEADFEQVAGAAEFAVSGQGLNVRIYEAGSLEVSVAGAGDVMLGRVREGLTVSIAGGGDINALRVDGPIQIAVQGAGDVSIRDGRVSSMSVAVMGAGDVSFGGEAEQLDAAIFGAGDIRVRSVTGEVSRRIFGVGEVTVGR